MSKSQNTISKNDDFRTYFAESVSEIVGIKGSFVLYNILIIITCLSLTIRGTFSLNTWIEKATFGGIGIILCIPGGLAIGTTLILLLLKYSLSTISLYVFTAYTNLLKEELLYNHPSQLRSSVEILREYSKDVVVPVIAGIICVFIPLIGGFIVGKIEKATSGITEKLIDTISSKTNTLTDPREQYSETIEIIEERVTKITAGINSTFNKLIFPFLVIGALYLISGIGTFTYFYF